MDNYKIIQDFIIGVLDGLRHRWKIDVENTGLPIRLIFENNINGNGVGFRYLQENKLGVEMFSSSSNQKGDYSVLKTVLDIEMISDLMDYLLKAGELNFQIGVHTSNPNAYSSSILVIESLLSNKKVRGYSLKEEEEGFSIFYGNKKYVNVLVESCGIGYLGGIALSCLVTPLTKDGGGYTVQYQKLIPQHRLEEFPNLCKKVSLPKLEKNIEDIDAIKLIDNINLENIGEFKPKILNFLLQHKLKTENKNKKTFKV